ncbi:MAG TPA: transporter substrate-binding domain-containing protein [Mesorhizobium sp.]
MKFAWIAEPPFNFREGSGITGCDVELARQVFTEIGEDFEPVETDFAQLLTGLQDGRWDVTTGMFITPQRAATTFFTVPIWAIRDGLLVRTGSEDPISGYRSLAASGGTLAVIEGQIQKETALANGISPSSIQAFRDYSEAAEAVVNGSVDAYASVELAHLAYISRAGAPGLTCVRAPTAEKAPEPGAFACRTSTIRDRMDEALRDFIGKEAHSQILDKLGLTLETLAV